MKKFIKVFSLLALSLASLVACKNKNKGGSNLDVSKIEAFYQLDNKGDERKDIYSITYGQNFLNVEVSLYAYSSSGEKTLIESKRISKDDGYTFSFESGSEEDFFSLTPPAGTYKVNFEYASKTDSLTFKVNPTDKVPVGFTLTMQDFEYNEVSNARPNLVFPEETTTVYYEYAEYGDDDVLGSYSPFFQNIPIYPGRYNLRVTVSSRNYTQVSKDADFTISKCAFPEDKYEVVVQSFYNFSYEFGKTKLGDYPLCKTTPSYRAKSTGEVFVDSTSELSWAQPNKHIPIFREPLELNAVFKSRCFKDYQFVVHAQFNATGIVVPYNLGVIDDSGEIIANSIAYDGQVHEIDFETGYASEEEVPYHIVEESSTLSATEVGVYEVVFALNEPDKTSWADDDSSNTNKVLTWEITKADLIPNYASKYRIQLGDLEFDIKNDKAKVKIAYDDVVAGEQFKLLVLKNGETEYEEFPAVFSNEEIDPEKVLSINSSNVLIEKPALTLEEYYAKVELPEDCSYCFVAHLTLMFYPDVNKNIILNKEKSSISNDYENVYINNLYVSEIHKNDLETMDGFIGLSDYSGFGLFYEGDAHEYLMTSVSEVSIRFSKVSEFTSELVCYVLTKEEYFARLAHFNPETPDPSLDLDECSKPEDDDAKNSYQFTSLAPIEEDTTYSFDFSDAEFKENKTYIVCFYLAGSVIHDGLEDKDVKQIGDAEVSSVEINCVRIPYF